MSVESHTQFMQVIEINVYTMKMCILWNGVDLYFRKGKAASLEVPIAQQGKNWTSWVIRIKKKKKKTLSGK